MQNKTNKARTIESYEIPPVDPHHRLHRLHRLPLSQLYDQNSPKPADESQVSVDPDGERRIHRVSASKLFLL